MAHAVGQSEAPAASRKSAWWIAAAWILPTVLLSPGLFANRVLFWHDVTRTMLPFRQLAAKAISEGRLPVWTHLSGAGAAPYGEGQAGVFYPPNSLSYVARIPPWTDYTLQLWLHLGIAATVTFLWLHRSHGLSAPAAYLGSQIFALSGFLVSHFMHLHIVQIAAWLPALLWLSEALARWEKPLPSFVVAAALVAALALAGFPQICYMIVLAALIWAAASAKSRAAAVRALGALCAASALGLLIAAVQLLPTAAHLAATGARAKPTIEFMRRYSLDWRGLLFFLQPEVFGSYHQGDYFGAIHHYEVCGWVGGVPLLLAPVALLAGTPGRRRLVIASALLVTGGLFLGLAQYNPVYHLLVHVPIISKFRAAG
ncbi:MAG: YfhO family protein, partial [Armatimonadetes bacterium]|nr:YfhO family protein [Armatimonadota bacterium]